jgi:deoxyribose-phosphate aldolase
VSGARADAARALACLDLTNLEEGATLDEIDALCARARTPRGPVAAVCVYPRFAERARAALAGSGIRIACVVNFPTGDRPVDFVRAMTADALAEGADEIDLVVPWRRLLAGNEAPMREMIRVVRQNLGGTVLKTILETGELGAPELVRRAATIAVEEGADFLKTSTGKVPLNATPEAVEILLEVAREAGRPVGVKAAGGIRSTEDAATYLALCDRVMGRDWAGPETFRFGASGLLDALLATIDDREAAPAPRGDGY